MAFPVIRFFHSNHPKYSIPLAMARLDEAITIQEIYQLGNQPDTFHWQMLRKALDTYLNSFDTINFKDYKNPITFRYRSYLKHLTIPLSEEQEQKKLEHYQSRRKKLAQLMYNDGWKWEDLYETT
jgi:hypothetical protein